MALELEINTKFSADTTAKEKKDFYEDFASYYGWTAKLADGTTDNPETAQAFTEGILERNATQIVSVVRSQRLDQSIQSQKDAIKQALGTKRKKQ